MNAEIQPIFATAIYKKRLRPLTEKEKEFLEQCNVTNQNAGNLMSITRRLIDAPELSSLKLDFQNCINDYADQIMHIKNQIYITSSWLNVSSANQHHNLHNHPNSILSGCFYIKVNDSQPTINFSRTTQPFLFNLDHHSFNSFNSTEWSLPVEDNMLILFPSSCYHYVKPNLTKNKRISLSFDTFIKGSLGSKSIGSDINI